MENSELLTILVEVDEGTKTPFKAYNEILSLFNVVGRSEQFYCDGQENGKDRCKTQCLGCAGMQEIYGQ